MRKPEPTVHTTHPEPQPRLQTQEQVMFFDTDAGGVVHNIAYLRFIETNRTLLAEQLGWFMADMVKTGVCPVVVRTEIDYRRPALLGDKLVVDGWLESFERSRFWCAFTITRPSDGQQLITCRQMLALVQLGTGRPLRTPAEWGERFPQLKKASEAR
jgi:YbgC/YbaW family acyl-CoA thioester hydrolase